MHIIIVVLAIASAALWGYVVGAIVPMVYHFDNEVMIAICDHSATVTSRDWEEACGMAQDVSGIEYKGENQ